MGTVRTILRSFGAGMTRPVGHGADQLSAA